MNLTLIGMPGSGKSFLSRRLARESSLALLELDALLERGYGKPLPRVLAELGDEKFLQAEEEAAIGCTSGIRNAVISPGGSIVYSPKAMAHLKALSTLVYLRVPLETLAARIGEAPRGIVGAKDRPLAALYEERTPLYEHWADEVLDNTGPAKGVLARLREMMQK